MRIFPREEEGHCLSEADIPAEMQDHPDARRFLKKVGEQTIWQKSCAEDVRQSYPCRRFAMMVRYACSFWRAMIRSDLRTPATQHFRTTVQNHGAARSTPPVVVALREHLNVTDQPRRSAKSMKKAEMPEKQCR